MKTKLQIVFESLKRNWFDARIVKDPYEANQIILDLISPKDLVGFGDSLTLKQLGIKKILKERGNILLDTIIERSIEQKIDVMRKTLHSDVFLTGCNAITLEGELINTDGAGNRVAAMIFGPKKVIVVVGENKIVKDSKEAIERIRKIAAPLNNKRKGRTSLSCVAKGICTNCNSKLRGCRVTSIMEKKPRFTDIIVILLKGSYGL